VVCVSRVIVYIDGFNLYYRALKNTPNKWLNLEALCNAVLPSGRTIVGINYYTARISGRVDPKAPARQHAYLRAIQTLPLVKIHTARFLVTTKWAAFVTPPNFQPAPIVAEVWKTEEKGSDVNLGVHLVRDALTGAFDEAAVLTNDTDLVEPVRIVTKDVKCPVILLTPVPQSAASLMAVASSTRHVQPYLGVSQFPDPVVGENGKVIPKPATW
jgi:uncharacterized LabA/DUF88 family protein